MRILIVEDDYVSSRLLLTILSPFGECDSSTNGVSAINQVKKAFEDKKPYDLICLDIMLPELDGYDVLKRIREFDSKHKDSNSQTKVIMVTALGDTESIKKSFSQKAEAYLIKPIYRDKLLETLKMMELIQ